MGFLNSLKGKLKDLSHHDQGAGSSTDAPPPEWSAAPEISHKWGKWNEAPDEEYQAGEDFCNEYPPLAPRLLPSELVDKINTLGCKAWGIQWPTTPRFSGHIQEAADTKGGPAVTTVTTTAKCKDTCLLSDMPILAGLYEVQGKTGVYYEVLVQKMTGFIAIGTACRPYPEWRLPGWNRLSAGLHLDDLRKFFEDPDGGRDYAEGLISSISPGDTIGCGYEFASGNLFYTYNGVRLPNAFSGLYIPRNQHDVFAAIGVEGECQFQVNFGGEVFRWKEGNEWAWRVEGHVGRLSGTSGPRDDELPAYEA
ncbi:hypothetical protein D9611_000882 [Ephemerocybe angulata]|uniref:B30.2/SPRY domain-containing protein n=1 Tax=Ephemerocybe angulata TaxID=980116 RepID=A0A8H5BQA0_9AGAR|nr:hypothetical protein D9611_000882 [Tulosesus angulatus]